MIVLDFLNNSKTFNSEIAYLLTLITTIMIFDAQNKLYDLLRKFDDKIDILTAFDFFNYLPLILLRIHILIYLFAIHASFLSHSQTKLFIDERTDARYKCPINIAVKNLQKLLPLFAGLSSTYPNQRTTNIAIPFLQLTVLLYLNISFFYTLSPTCHLNYFLYYI